MFNSMEKMQNQTKEEGIISNAKIKQVLQSMRLETKVPSYADIAAFIEDVLFVDKPTLDDIYIANLFESFDVPNSKYDAMKYDFAYLCDLSFDNDEHFI